jgi:dihydroxyacetone kinase
MLSEAGIKVHATEIGEFCTSQEMKGMSVTLVKVDDELKRYFDMPCLSPFYVKP